MASSYRTINIESFEHYIHQVKELCTNDIELFRGQNADESLVPRVGRLNYKHKDKGIEGNERDLFREYKRLSVPYLQMNPNNDWEWLTLAQHHCLPTRLLDWTINPLAGLWFAIEKLPKRAKNGEEMSAVVWVFAPDTDEIVNLDTIDRDGTSPFDVPKTLVFQPNVVSNRINAQQGWFSIHKFDSKKGKFISFETNRSYKSRLTKFLIKPSLFSDIRYDLDRFGVNKASLFPDLDSLNIHLTWLHTLMDDEKSLINKK